MSVIRGQTMGTTYMIKYVGKTDALPKTEKIKKAVEKILKKVNRQMSTYLPYSEISRFNKYKQNDWFEISADLTEVVEKALLVSEKSAGAFDITVGPLVNLWGFGPQAKPEKVPPAEKIKEVKKYTGCRNLSVRHSPPAIKKDIPGIYCDLSGIAKGFGVDKVAEYLDSRDIEDYLVEIGGEVRTKGKNKDNRCWRLGVAAPDNGLGIYKTLPLKNAAMATSGDYRNYFEENGIRYSHTINPVTGKPITHKLVSVTVIHDSCTYADAMATAINVLGPEKGYRLAQQEKLAVLLIIKEKDKFIEKMTSRFKKILEVAK